MKKILLIIAAGAFAILSGCSAESKVASHNLSKAADMFQIDRRIVFYNGITGGYMLTIEGKCSVKSDSMDGQLEVTCKTGHEMFKKHYLGLSDNVTYFIEQINSVGASTYRYKVIFNPATIIPDVDLKK